MRLSQLEYLLAVREQGSITRAAQHLYIAQPSLSAAIRDLEAELGFELMKRTKKGTTLTYLGEQVAEKAAHIFQEIEDIRCLDQVESGRMVGRILLSAVPFACEYFLLDVLVKLKTEHPDLHLLLEENDGMSAMQQVGNNEADLGVVMISGDEMVRFQQALTNSSLHYEKIFQDELCFLVGEENPYFAREQVTMAEILRFPYVYYKDAFTPEDQRLFSQHCAPERLELIRMKDQASIKKFVMRSQATTVAPYQAAESNIYVQTGKLHRLRLTGESWPCAIGVVYRKDRALKREELFLLGEMRGQVAAFS